jgi:dTDP-4-amino-4,6-dideoxygalactose transaminase
MNIPLVDLKAQYDSIREEIDEAIHKVIEGGQFILGPEVEALEHEIAAYLGVRYAVGVASGTEALQLALLACGIKPGDRVITTPFTFIATAEAITQCGATPVFVDIDPRTYNIDPVKVEQYLQFRQITGHQSPRTPTPGSNSVGSPLPRGERSEVRVKAILPVHLYGQPADMEPILRLARKYDIRVIEDCAQSLGAAYTTSESKSRSSRKLGSLGDAGCLSFFPSKVLGAYGDGGMVVTNDREIAERVRMLRNHGCQEKYYHLIPGFNSRLDSLQAAILRVKLRHLDEWIEQRQKKAALYSRLLGTIDGIQPPYVAPYAHHVFNYYTIRIPTSPESQSEPLRTALQQHLSSRGIATAIYYPLSLHLQQVYKHLGYKPGDFPESEKAQEEVLSLPIYPELEDEQIENIAAVIGKFIKGD